MIRFLSFVFFTFLLSAVQLSAQEVEKQFLLSSGGIGGNYNKTGQYITHQLDSLYPSFGFRNIVSSGSLENLEKLDQRFTDMAISQRDVLLEKIYDDTKGIKNIQIILPLFQEKLLVYKKSNTQYKSFEEFGKNLHRVGITNKESISYKTFLKICRLLNISIDDAMVIEGSYPELRNLIATDSIDAVVSFSLPLPIIEEIPNLTLQGLSDQEISLIASRINNIYPVETEVGGAKTLGSWTFLVGLDNSILEIEKLSKNGIATDLYNVIQGSNDPIAKRIKNSVDFFANKQNQALLYGMPISASTGKVLNYNTFSLSFLLYLIPILLLLLTAVFVFRKRLLSLDYRILWIRYNHIILGVLIIFVLYFLSVEGLLLSERNFYRDLGIKSRVLNLTKSDLHLWVIITNLTGNNNNIFPLSYTGQVLLSFSSYVIIAGTLAMGLFEFIIYRMNKKRIKGMMSFNDANHIVVIGWRSNTPEFLEELLVAQKKSRKSFKKIICIVENPEELINKSAQLKKLEALRKIHLVAGDAREEEVLKKVNIQLADTVVILAEDHSNSADEKTLLRALAISRYCRKIALNQKTTSQEVKTDYDVFEVEKYVDSIYIIAELNDKKYSEDLKRSDVNEIINSSEYSKNILTQSLLNHGVSKVLDEVLSQNDFNEFSTINLTNPIFKNLVNKTYDELLPILREKGILLIGIRMVYHDTMNNEIIDEEELKKLLSKDGLSRQILINPITPIEKNRVTDPDDQLIVFCERNEDILAKFK